jgi:methyl-accepting chemotaxis protein
VAEEISSTAQELSAQAEQLQTTIAFFKVNDNGGGRSAIVGREPLKLEKPERRQPRKIHLPHIAKPGGNGHGGNGKSLHRELSGVASGSGHDAKDREFERF